MSASVTPIAPDKPQFLDDVVRELGADKSPSEVFAFPRDPNGVDDYEKFTGHDLDRFVEATVKYLIASGLEPGNHEPVAVFAYSGVEFINTVFALSRLGYSPVFLSVRLGPVAVAHLLEKTGCRAVVHGGSEEILGTARAVREAVPATRLLPIATREVYDVALAQPRFAPGGAHGAPGRDPNAAFAIFHSSGSTGFPKPIYWSQSNLFQKSLFGEDDVDCFVSRPLHYGFSFMVFLAAIWRRSTCYVYNNAVPMTPAAAIRALKAANGEHIQGVPHTLELLGARPDGVELLKKAKMVTIGGARLSDELGDRLTAQGVHINNTFGSSEAGFLGGSGRRPRGDPTWDYIRFMPRVVPHLHMDPCGGGGGGGDGNPSSDHPGGEEEGLCELVYLPSHPGLVAPSNSDSPVPGSYRSRDLLRRHPTISDAWKFVARADDRVTLSGGANVIPLPLEGGARDAAGAELVRDAVLVGLGRPRAGLLVFRGPAAAAARQRKHEHVHEHEDDDDDDDDEEDERVRERIVEAIRPAVDRHNALSEEPARILADMIRVLPAGVEPPVTDKGNIIRAQVYERFAGEIDQMYAARPQAV